MESPRGRAEGAPSPSSPSHHSQWEAGSPSGAKEDDAPPSMAARMAAFNGGTPVKKVNTPSNRPPLAPNAGSGAINDELEMVRRARSGSASGGASAGACECAAAAHTQKQQQHEQQQQQHGSSPGPGQQHAGAGSGSSGGGPGLTLSMPTSATNSDGSSSNTIPTLGIVSPRQAHGLTQQQMMSAVVDGDYSQSPRRNESPRPSFVPPLQLGGVALKGLGAAGAAANAKNASNASAAPPQSPRDPAGYMAALGSGGLSDMVRLSPRSPRSHPSSQSQQQGGGGGGGGGAAAAGAAMAKQRPQIEDDVLLPKASIPKQMPGKQMPSDDGGGEGKGKRLPQQEDSSLADSPSSPALALNVGVEGNPYSSRGRPARGNGPLVGDGGLSLGLGLDLSAGADGEEEADDSSFVMATPRTPRLSARHPGAKEDFKPLNGLSSGHANGQRPDVSDPQHGGLPPLGAPLNDPGAQMVITPRGGSAIGVRGRVESPRGAPPPMSGMTADGLVLTARNVMLTPRGGGRPGGLPLGGLPDPLPPHERGSGMGDGSMARVESPRVSMPEGHLGGASPPSGGASPPGRVEMPPLQLPGSEFPSQPPPPQAPTPPKKGGGKHGGDGEKQSHMTEMTRTTFTDDDVESFEVTVPDGAQPGAVLRLTLPSGELVEIPVPEGAVPGDKLSFELSKSSLQAVEMALSGEQIIFPGRVCKGKKVKKPPQLSEAEQAERRGGGGPLYEVVVPKGWLPGFHTHFQAQLGEVVAAIPVPDHCEPNTVLHVEAPVGTSKVDVVIPEDATPGSQFVANVGGQLVNVPCPPHMRPGQTLSVAVAGDAALELGEVRIVKAGKPRAPSRGRHIVAPSLSHQSGSSSARRRQNSPPMAPSYEMNVSDGRAPSPAHGGMSARSNSPGSARGGMSPGRQSARGGGDVTPGRASSPGSSRGPRPKRSSSPVSRAAAMLGGRSKK